MLNIVRSGFSTAARDAFGREILKLSEQGRKACLIVPEQQTVMAEEYIWGILPPSAALTFEVTNFTRLANSTFRALGGLSAEYCDSVKKSLIMWRTLTELAPVLTMTSGRKEINAGLVASALSAISEMQSLSITPELLMESIESDEVKADGRLLGKLRDLSGIYALYKSLLSEKYADTGDDGEAMVQKLKENPTFLADTHIFIEGFTSFTEPQYRLIAMLSARTEVSVALTLPKGREDAFEFSEVLECQKRLSSESRKSGGEIKLTREEGIYNSPDELREICSLLWSTILPNEKISLQKTDILRIFEAKTPYDECAFVCEDIQKKVMEGASYSDFAIITGNADNYIGILDTALGSAGVPAFTSYRRDVQEFEAIKMIYTAYAVTKGFAREDVISYAKCSLTGVSRELCDEFESYVNKWQINGKRFTDGEIWNMNPLGYTLNRPEGTDEKLIRIHSVREKIVSPLIIFSDRSRKATTVTEQARVLLDFLLEIGMEKALLERAKALADMGEDSLARENATLWKMICDSLDTLVSVMGDSPADFETFLNQLKIVFSATDVGRIPAYADRVTVGSADMLRLYSKPHIYLIGVNAGVFPAGVSDSSYFSERDRKILSNCGLSIRPELEIKGARELYVFSRAFSYASGDVTISYSSADTRMKGIQPAEVVKRIGALCGALPVKIENLPTVDRIFTPASALERMGDLGEDYDEVRDALLRSGHGNVVEIAEGDITNSTIRLGESVLAQTSDGPLSLSQSKIDKYVNCPFGYFCKHTIKLNEEERAEFDSMGIGLFIHSILENFFSTLNEEGRKSSELSKEERQKLTRAAAEKYISRLGNEVSVSAARTKIKIDRLCRAALPVVDSLCEEFSVSAFEPRFFELSLTMGENSPDPISINTQNGIVNIYGVIDRVDAYKRGEDVYLRVIDYKTGNKSFSPNDMAEGFNLQMFLYLKALVESDKEKFHKRLDLGEGGRVIPAGVIYVETKISDVRVDLPDDAMAEEAVKNAQVREGMILDDPDIISAMNIKYTPVYSNKSPGKIIESKKKLLYTEEGWQDIMQTVEQSVIRVADGIREGKMPAVPKWLKDNKSACEFCPYKPICRKVEKARPQPNND